MAGLGFLPDAVTTAASAKTERKEVDQMTTATPVRPEAESVHRHVVTDAELEATAEESALSYTFQTDAYYTCCY
jgi:hypothetical protein